MVHPVAAIILSKKAWAGWLSPLPATGTDRLYVDTTDTMYAPTCARWQAYCTMKHQHMQDTHHTN